MIRDVYLARTIPYTQKSIKNGEESIEIKIPRICDDNPNNTTLKSFSDLTISQIYDFYGIFDAESQTISVIYYEKLDSICAEVGGAAGQVAFSDPVIDENEIPLSLSSDRDIYENLLEFLSQIFYGDKLAAKYFLIWACSSVYARADPLPLGKLAINFCNFPEKNYAKDFNFQVLNKLLPASKYLEITLDGLNDDDNFACPKKNYETGTQPNDDPNHISNHQPNPLEIDADLESGEAVLVPGFYQAAPSTAFVISDNFLTAGKLEHQGCQNLKILRSLIEWQTLTYDFKFYQQEFLVDYRFLQFTSSKAGKTDASKPGSKKSESNGFLTFDLSVNLPEEVNKLDDDVINFYQIITQHCQKLGVNKTQMFQIYANFIEKTRISGKNLKLSDQENKEIEKFWVEHRAQHRNASNVPEMTPDDLHRLLTMSRIYKSLVETEYKFSDILEMEKVRKSRLN